MLPSLSPSSVSGRWSLSLILLCAVQSCERFAFLAMLPLFVLYAQDRHAMSAPKALLVLAVFQALSYLGGLPGGWAADRKLGLRVSSLLGTALLTCGYAGLALDRSALLWPSLGLMVAGHSFFKPGLHVLLGRVTSSDERAQERAFLWHYLATNVGHVAGALFGEWAAARFGWPSLFGGAAVALAVGVMLLAVSTSWLRSRAGDRDNSSAKVSSASTAESMRAVWLLCGVAVVLWLTANQAGGSLTLFAAMNTVQQVAVFGRSFQMGPGHFASLHGLMVSVMLLIFLLIQGSQRSDATSTAGKMIWGYVATAAAFVLMAAAGLLGGDGGRVSGAWLVSCYVLLSLAELLLGPLGVSLLTRLAPQGKAAQAVGLWFAGCAVGNGLAGALGLCWDRWPHHRYFALLALVSIGAAAVLLPRRRQLDWLTALSLSASSKPVLDERMNTMTSTPDLAMSPLPSNLPAPSRGPRPLLLVLASLSILLPAALMVTRSLPLPVRGAGAIICGFAVLLCGSYLLGQALEQPNPRATDSHG